MCRNELDELAEEIGEVNQELRRSLRSIVNSIRGLLTTFDPESGRANDASREGESNPLEGDAEDTDSSGPEDNVS